MKKLLSVILALAMVLSLTACAGGSNTTTAAPEPQSTAAPAQTTAAPAQTTAAPAQTTAAPAQTTAAPPETTAEPEPAKEKIMRVASGSLCGTANPTMMNSPETDLVNFEQALLYRWFPKEDGSGRYLRGEIADGDPIQVDEEGKVWDIKIRQGITFVDYQGNDTGKEITAELMEDCYKLVLEPSLATRGADYMNTYVIVANAKEYFTQTAEAPVKWEDVGIKAKDKYTLEITLAASNSALNVMKNFQIYNLGPFDPDLMRELMSEDKSSTQYGITEDKAVYCGPFYLNQWVKEATLILKKNPNYPFADEIALDTVEVRYIENAQTKIELFRSGEVDYTGLNDDQGTDWNESPYYIAAPNRYIAYIEICDSQAYYEKTDDGELKRVEVDKSTLNFPILSDLDFKAALWYAVDRATLAKMESGIPVTYIVPNTSIALETEDGTVFFKDTDVAKSYRKSVEESYNPTLAKEYFEKAMKNNGYGEKDKLTLEFIYNSGSSFYSVMALFLQETLGKVFGEDRFELKLMETTSADRLAKVKGWRQDPNSFQLAVCMWSQGVSDESPYNMFNVYSSSYWGKCNSSYHCDTVEKNIWLQTTDSRVLADREYNTQLAGEMEKAFLEEYSLIPMFERTSQSLAGDRVIMPIDPSLGYGYFFFLWDVED